MRLLEQIWWLRPCEAPEWAEGRVAAEGRCVSSWRILAGPDDSLQEPAESPHLMTHAHLPLLQRSLLAGARHTWKTGVFTVWDLINFARTAFYSCSQISLIIQLMLTEVENNIGSYSFEVLLWYSYPELDGNILIYIYIYISQLSVGRFTIHTFTYFLASCVLHPKCHFIIRYIFVMMCSV